MRLIIRTIILVAILWIGVLLSGYGVLFHSEENVGGLGLKCQYLTAAESAPHFMFIPTAE